MSAEGPRRRGRRPAGEDTRAQILAAAREVFAGQGYDAASIRAIAREAEVDPALVHHYFNGKSDLFAQAVVSEHVDPARSIGALADTPREQLGEAIIRTFLGLWDAEPRRSAFVAMIQAALSNDEALRPLREYLQSAILTRFPLPPDDPQRELRAQVMASQVIGLAIGRFVVRLPELAGASAEDIVQIYGANLQHCIDRPLSPDNPMGLHSSHDE